MFSGKTARSCSFILLQVQEHPPSHQRRNLGDQMVSCPQLLLFLPRAAFLYREKPGLCLWLLWLHGTACREDELGSQNHILKLRWLIREKFLATSLSRSSCPVLFFFSFSLDLMVTPFPFKRVLPLFFCVVCSPTYQVRGHSE